LTDWSHARRVYHRIDSGEIEQGTTPNNHRLICGLAGDPSFLRRGLADHCRSCLSA
jgi:hypothetical protein